MRAVVTIFALILGTLQAVSRPTDPYLSGRACMVKEKYDSALVYLNHAVENNPGNAEYLYYRGICQFRLMQYAAAYEDFLQVERRKEGMASFHMAKTEVHLKHPEQAIKYLRIHLSSRYKLPEKDILLDEDLSTLEQRADWKALWKEKDWYNQNDREFQEAHFMTDHGEYLDAINMLNALEKRGYNKSEVLTLKAEIFEKLGNEKAVASEIDKAVASDSRNHKALAIRADHLRMDGKHEDALADYNKLIRLDPARFSAYLSRAAVKGEVGDLDGAIEDVDTYLNYFPEKDTAWFIKGKIQYSHKKYLNAIQSINRALDMNNGKPEYFHYRGLIYSKTGTLQYAEKDFSMALDLDPLNGESWLEKGKVASRLGKPETACFDYKKAFQYGIYEARDFIDKHCLMNE